MTFDQVSRLGIPTPPITSPNTRTPLFDLQFLLTVTGQTVGRSYMTPVTQSNSGSKQSEFEDLPRDPVTNRAFLGDPRNDENMMIAGIYVPLPLFHNHAVDLVRSQNPGIPDSDAYVQAPPAHVAALPMDDLERVPSAYRRLSSMTF